MCPKSQSNPAIKNVVVTIVNYNGRSYLHDCLSSICATDYSHFHIVVVDNASSDRSADFIEEHFPQVVLIRNEKNRGLPAGINIGAKYACALPASYVVFINTDTVVDRRWLRQAVEVAEGDPLIGILSFTEFGRATDTTYSDFLDAQRQFSKVKVSYSTNGPGQSPFFMIRMRVFEELGLFDEKYFAYGDDSDFEWRVIRAGFKLATINLPCFHHGMGTFKHYPLLASRLAIRNVLRLHLVHSSPRYTYRLMSRIFNFACNPWFKYDKKNYRFKRYRPSNIFVNFWVFAYAIVWNVYNLPNIIITRKRTTRIVSSVRKKIDDESLSME